MYANLINKKMHIIAFSLLILSMGSQPCTLLVHFGVTNLYCNIRKVGKKRYKSTLEFVVDAQASVISSSTGDMHIVKLARESGSLTVTTKQKAVCLDHVNAVLALPHEFVARLNALNLDERLTEYQILTARPRSIEPIRPKYEFFTKHRLTCSYSDVAKELNFAYPVECNSRVLDDPELTVHYSVEKDSVHPEQERLVLDILMKNKPKPAVHFFALKYHKPGKVKFDDIVLAMNIPKNQEPASGRKDYQVLVVLNTPIEDLSEDILSGASEAAEYNEKALLFDERLTTDVRALFKEESEVQSDDTGSNSEKFSTFEIRRAITSNRMIQIDNQQSAEPIIKKNTQPLGRPKQLYKFLLALKDSVQPFTLYKYFNVDESLQFYGRSEKKNAKPILKRKPKKTVFLKSNPYTKMPIF